MSKAASAKRSPSKRRLPASGRPRRSFGGRPGCQHEVTRPGIRRIVAGHDPENGIGITDGASEDRDGVEGAASRQHASARHGAERGLEADNVVEPGWNAARAGRVGADREGDQSVRHRDRRAAAGAARHVRRIESVARRRVGRSHADEAGGELVEVGLADKDGTRFEKTGDRRSGLGYGM